MSSISAISFTLFLLVAISQAQPTSIHDEYLRCLQSQNSITLLGVSYSPSNSSYISILNSAVRNLRTIVPPFITDRPNIIITPTHEFEIQAAVRCASKTNIQIRVRSGGHDYEGLSHISSTPYVLIDLRNFSSISIDTKDNTAWVGAGSTLGELYHKIATTSETLAFVAGVCPTVGVGGHFSGGGYGMLSRQFGLAVDNIIDARVMNINGEILDGRESMGEDLFWAIRGGGGTSYGLVLSWKIKLLTIPEEVTVFNVTRTMDQNATKLLEKWQNVSTTIDERLLLRVFINSVYSAEDRKKTIFVSFTSLFVGETDELLVIMKNNFPELGLEEKDCEEMDWIDSILFFAAPFLPDHPNINDLLNRSSSSGAYFKGKSDYVTRPISENGWKTIFDRLLGEGDFSSQLQLSPYGGRMSQISESETPFPHRAGTIFMIHYGVNWRNETESMSRINWMRRLYQFMAPYVSKSPRGAYFNYRDLDLGTTMRNGTSYASARVWGTKYFKNNFDRLVHVKTTVDPYNFFRNEQSIPPVRGM